MPSPVTLPSQLAPPPVLGSPSPASRGWPVPSDLIGPEQFADLYADQFPALVRFLHALGQDTAEAQDIAQEAFMVLLRNLERGYLMESTGPYLFGIARNVALRRIRERNREIPIELIGIDYRFVRDTADEVIDGDDALRMIRTLPPAQRNVMLLAYDGFRPSEISEIIGVSVATVRSNLRHARIALKQELLRGEDH